MRVWLACFLVLFALAELFDWVQELKLPLPIYILGGAFLAVASNYDKLFGFYLNNATGASSEQSQLDSPLDRVNQVDNLQPYLVERSKTQSTPE